MNQISIEFVGFDKLLTMFDPARSMAILDKGVNRVGEHLRDATKKLPPVSAERTGFDAIGIPVDHGRLRQSIQKRKAQMMAADVYAGVNYGSFVHDGTSRMPGRPFFQWVLEIEQDRVRSIVNQHLREILTP